MLLGAAYVSSLELRPDEGRSTPPRRWTGAGLLAVAELAYWSVELRRAGRRGARLLARRPAAVAALAFVSLAARRRGRDDHGVPLGGGVPWDAVGVAAAAAALTLILASHGGMWRRNREQLTRRADRPRCTSFATTARRWCSLNDPGRGAPAR